MARKRSLKDVAGDQSVEKSKAVSDAAAPVVEEVKAPVAGKEKATTARKRSLKDAAADQLVEKSKAVSDAAAPVGEETKTADAGLTEETANPVAASAPQSAEKPLFVEDFSSKTIESGKKGQPSLKWIAILLLTGFFGGYFFGVGQAIGPANLAFILIGFFGGYFFGRFYKII